METVLIELEKLKAKLEAYWKTKNDLEFHKELEFKGVKAALDAFGQVEPEQAPDAVESVEEAPQHEEGIDNGKHVV